MDTETAPPGGFEWLTAEICAAMARCEIAMIDLHIAASRVGAGEITANGPEMLAAHLTAAQATRDVKRLLAEMELILTSFDS